jgi:hypothetical protein
MARAAAKPTPKRKSSRKPAAPKPPVFKHQAGFALTQVLEVPEAPPGTQVRYWSVAGKVQYVVERGTDIVLRAPTLEALVARIEETTW